MNKALLYLLGGVLAVSLSAVTTLTAQTSSAHPFRTAQANLMEEGKEAMLGQIARALNMDKEMLRSELESGKTLGQVLQDRDVSRQEFRDRVMSQARTDLNQKVQEGKITEQQAGQLEQRFQELLDDNMDEILNRQYPLRQEQQQPQPQY